MKILAISLLRMGDLIQLNKALATLRSDYPEAELHLLTNRSNAAIAENLDIADKYFYFDRDIIQESLGSVETSFFEASDRIQDLFKRLNSQNYEKAYNLTHNRISGIFLGQITAEEKHGLQIFNDGQSQLGESWYRFLNDYSLSGATEQLHLIDVYSFMANNKKPVIKKIKTKKSSAPSIAIQPWSSEAKKDWDDDSWLQFLKIFRLYSPNHRIQVLHSEENKGRFDQLNIKLKGMGLVVEGLCLSLYELSEELRDNCELLISVDTGIMHFASELGVKVFELSFGGNNFQKTGVYQEGALILSSKVGCYPCPVGIDCTNNFSCKTINPEDVAALAFEHLRGQSHNINEIATELKDQFDLHKVSISEDIGFQPIELGSVDLEKRLDSYLYRASLINIMRAQMDGDLDQKIDASATIAIEVRKIVAKNSMQDKAFSLEAYFSKTEKKTRQVELLIDDCVKALREDMQSWGQQENLNISVLTQTKIKQLEDQLSLGCYLSQFCSKPSFYNSRRLISCMQDLLRMQRLIWKAIRSFATIKELDLT